MTIPMPPRSLAGLLAAVLLLVACSPAPVSPSSVPGATAPGSAEKLLYACGRFPFDPALLRGLALAELGPDPAAAALRAHLADPGVETASLPDSGWVLVGRDERGVEFVAADPAGGHAIVTVTLGADGWQVGGWGGCTPEAELGEGIGVATWQLADGAEVGPGTTRISALVTERACASGDAPGARLLAPQVSYRADAVVVVFGVREPGGAQECPSNPETPVEIVLAEPLGERSLLDGSLWPPRDPAAPEG